jgi:3-deoxy-D-manno-octulosonate 8-phosphate phosphatase (KDO 8-P phosphatase)
MINYIFIDIDGTLTDGKISYNFFGQDIKFFNVKDGSSIKKVIYNGVQVILLTGRNSNQNKIRAKELGIKLLYQNISNKKSFVLDFLNSNNLPIETGSYFGDDENDLEAMSLFNYRFCPFDASNSIKNIATFISPIAAGNGAFSLVAEYIITINNGGKL